MAAKTATITRVRICKEELDKMSKEQLQKCWNLQDSYIDLLENKLQSNSEHTELLNLRESEEKLKQQQLESSRRENILVMRLTTKEHEMQEFAGQIQELKQAQVPTIAQLRSALLDPAVNLLFERMRKEVEALKARLEETQNELNAWKFTPDSNTGKRLMSKCRLLYQENEELGKIISSGRMAKLEGDLALQKSFSEEMKKSQSELDEFLLELDEDVEGMQSTIYYLQQQLREAKEQITQLQKEKLDLSVISNGINVNHLSNSPMDSECRSPQVRVIVENSQANNISKDPAGNRTDQNSSPNEPNSIEQTSPFPLIDPKNIKTEKPSFDAKENSFNKLAQKDLLQESPCKSEALHSIAVDNKSSMNHEKPSERKHLAQGSFDLSEKINVRTNDPATDSFNAKGDISNSSNESSQNSLPSTNKQTSEGGRGRKRTRQRASELDIKEESLPMRKRTRRREAEAARIEALEEKRTPMEIDTDTEVQVAQTLASWASTKQERTEIKSGADENLLGNGELETNVENK